MTTFASIRWLSQPPALLWAAAASAQTPASTTSAPASLVVRQPTPRRGRRRRRSSATPGCGLCRPLKCWPDGKWSASAYRRGTNYIAGLHQRRRLRRARSPSGIKDRAEIFGSFLVDTRIDRDVRPLFIERSELRRRHRSLSARDAGLDGRQRRRPVCRREGQSAVASIGQKPAALAVRGLVKLPTGQERRRRRARAKRTSRSISIVSKEVAQAAELSGYAGYEFRGHAGRLRRADERVPVGRGRRVSVAQPAAGHGGAERRGAVERARRRSRAAPLVAIDGSVAPLRVEHGEPDARDARR